MKLGSQASGGALGAAKRIAQQCEDPADKIAVMVVAVAAAAGTIRAAIADAPELVTMYDLIFAKFMGDFPAEAQKAMAEL